MATKLDLGVYLPHYLQYDINWQTWRGASYEVEQVLALCLTPGHTPGLSILQVNMPQSKTWAIATDQYDVRETCEDSQPKGWLVRDQDDWVKSPQGIMRL